VYLAPLGLPQLTVEQTMNGDLFQYEKVAGRPLLLPFTADGLGLVDKVGRERTTQEEAGTFVPDFERCFGSGGARKSLFRRPCLSSDGRVE